MKEIVRFSYQTAPSASVEYKTTFLSTLEEKEKCRAVIFTSEIKCLMQKTIKGLCPYFKKRALSLMFLCLCKNF